MSAKFIAETPQDAEQISPVVPMIQPMFKESSGCVIPSSSGILCQRKRYQDTTFQVGFTNHQKDLFNKDPYFGSNSQ